MKIQLKYGFIVAFIIAIVNIILCDLVGIENPFVRDFSGTIPVVIFAAGLFLGMREIRKKDYNNEINYGQAIFSGLAISILIALVLGFLNTLYYGLVNTGYAERVVSNFQAISKGLNLKPDVIALQIKDIRESYLPFNQFKGTLLFFSLIGIILSSIFSSILRTKDTFTQILKNKE